MRKLTWALVTVVAFGATTVARAEQAAPVDYDCTLFNECGAPAPGEAIDRGKTKGFSMAAGLATATPQKVAVRTAAPSMARAKPAPQYVPPVRATAPVSAAAMSGVDLQLNFVTGSADLTPGARASADRLASAMMKPERLSTRFMIEGHTDAIGDRAYNLDLSRKRAAAVVDYLARKGVDTKRFETAGYGFDRPIAGTSANNGANRRVVAKAIK